MSYKILKDHTIFQINRAIVRKREFLDALQKNLHKSAEMSSKAFDKVFPGHNDVFCSRIAYCYEVITPLGLATLQEKFPENYKNIYHLCTEGLNLLIEAYQTLRNGGRTGSAAILRQSLECLALALALWYEPDKYLSKFQAGELSGEKVIGIAKKLIPFLGRLYGIFCDHFVHPSVRFVGRSLLPTHPMFSPKGRIQIGSGYIIEFHKEFAHILSFAQLMGMAYQAGIELMFWDTVMSSL